MGQAACLRCIRHSTLSISLCRGEEMIGLGPGSLPEMHKYSTLSLCRGARLLPAAGKLGGGGG